MASTSHFDSSTVFFAMWGFGAGLCGATFFAGWTLLSVLLVAAIWLVVPTALYLIERPGPRDSGSEGAVARLRERLVVALPAGATLGTLSLALDPSLSAAAASAGWGAICLALASLGLLRLARRGLGPSEELAADIGLVSTAVGGGWLVLSRLPGDPTGFGPLLPTLTAAHFHVGALTLGAGYAGIGRLLPLEDARSLATLHALGTGAYALGFVLVAIGISGVRPLELVGTLVLACAVLGLVGLVWRAIPRARETSRWVAAGLGVASIAALVGIGSAGLYAWGRWPGPATVTIPTMVRLHGTLNTFGFALPLLGALAYLAPPPRAPKSIPFSNLSAIEGRVGPDFFDRAGAATDGPAEGFVADMDVFARSDFPTDRLDPAVRAFYEQTDDFRILVRPQWQPGWRWAGRLWHRLTEPLGQMRLPVGGRDPETAVESRVVALSEAVDGRRSPRGWVRSYADSGEAMYVAAYSTHRTGRHTYMNIAFPWWGGHLTSILHPDPLEFGAEERIGIRLHTLADPRGGDQGVYVVHNTGAHVRRVRLPMDESIRVWPVDAPRPPATASPLADEAVALARHDLWLGGLTYLRLDYALVPE